jgi:hypothetical protein
MPVGVVCGGMILRISFRFGLRRIGARWCGGETGKVAFTMPTAIVKRDIMICNSGQLIATAGNLTCQIRDFDLATENYWCKL